MKGFFAIAVLLIVAITVIIVTLINADQVDHAVNIATAVGSVLLGAGMLWFIVKGPR